MARSSLEYMSQYSEFSDTDIIIIELCFQIFGKPTYTLYSNIVPATCWYHTCIIMFQGQCCYGNGGMAEWENESIGMAG